MAAPSTTSFGGTWGSWDMTSAAGGTQGMRVGIEYEWDTPTYGGSTVILRSTFWTQNRFKMNDTQTMTFSGVNTVDATNYTNNTGPTTGTTYDDPQYRFTRSYTYTYPVAGQPNAFHTSPGSHTVGASVSGVDAAPGIAPSHSRSTTIPARPGTAPGAPGVSSTPGNGSVSVSYSAPGFTGYAPLSYEYSTDNFYYTATTANPIVFTGLSNGTSYTYYVRARNDYGVSGGTSTSNTPRTTPGAPTISSSPSNGSISVSYGAPGSDGGESIDSYEYSLNGTSGWTATPSNPFTLSGANGTAINAYVRAVNAAGAGASSGVTTSTPRTTPGAPSVTSTPTNGSVSITYGAPASDGGNAVSSYQYSTDNSSWVGTPSNPFSINGANGTAITIYVRAVNAAGGGASASATSTPRTTPSAPTSVTSTPSNGSVSIGFGAPSSNGGNAVSSYQYSTNNSTWTTVPSNPFPISGANGTAITIYVRAVNAAGGGTSASATSTPRQPPTAPTSFTGNSATFAQISLSWGAPSSDGGNAVTSYVLRNGSTILQNSIATSYTHTGLLPYENYSYTVTAANAGGEGTQASLTIRSLGGIAKIWNGTSWITTLPKIWNGTAWVDAQARMWDGTEWKHGI